jgi:hypothetical protein
MAATKYLESLKQSLQSISGQLAASTARLADLQADNHKYQLALAELAEKKAILDAEIATELNVYNGVAAEYSELAEQSPLSKPENHKKLILQLEAALASSDITTAPIVFNYFITDIYDIAYNIFIFDISYKSAILRAMLLCLRLQMPAYTYYKRDKSRYTLEEYFAQYYQYQRLYAADKANYSILDDEMRDQFAAVHIDIPADVWIARCEQNDAFTAILVTHMPEGFIVKKPPHQQPHQLLY